MAKQPTPTQDQQIQAAEAACFRSARAHADYLAEAQKNLMALQQQHQKDLDTLAKLKLNLPK